MILGTTDTVNDVTTIKAIYTISQSLETNLAQETNKINLMSINELKTLVAKYNFLTYVHLRGEYVSYNLISKDQKLFSLFSMSKKDDLDNIIDLHVKYLSQINEILNNDVFIK